MIVGRSSAFHMNCNNSLKTKTFESKKHSIQSNIATELILIFKGLCTLYLKMIFCFPIVLALYFSFIIKRLFDVLTV